MRGTTNSPDRQVLVNGDSAAGALLAAGVVEPGELLILRDVLSCGPLSPLPESGDLAGWLPPREVWWRAVWRQGEGLGLVHGPFPAYWSGSDDLYAGGAKLRRARRLVVAVGLGFSDTLFAGFLLAWAARLGIDKGALRLARFDHVGRDSGGQPLVALPHLSPPELAAGWAPRPLEPEESQELSALWSAWAGAERIPERSLDVLDLQPWLHPAISAWRNRLPDPVDGLTGWDRKLLAAASEPAATLQGVIGSALRGTEDDPDPVGDLVLAHRLASFARAEAPRALIRRFPEPANLDARCALTDPGRRVLEGRNPRLARAWARDWFPGSGADTNRLPGAG